MHSWKYGNISLFEFFYIFQCFQAPVQYCRVMLKLFDWWSKFAWITTHIVKNISCVFVTVRSRKYGDVSLFEFFYISQCFQASVPHCEVMLKLFDWWSEFSWINWHFVKNISCVFVKVHSRKYGNVSLLEFFYIFSSISSVLQSSTKTICLMKWICMDKVTLCWKHYLCFRECALMKYGNVSLFEFFYIFQCF